MNNELERYHDYGDGMETYPQGDWVLYDNIKKMVEWKDLTPECRPEDDIIVRMWKKLLPPHELHLGESLFKIGTTEWGRVDIYDESDKVESVDIFSDESKKQYEFKWQYCSESPWSYEECK